LIALLAVNMNLSTNPKRLLTIAFFIGATIHAVLLGLSLTASGFSDMATFLLLIFALPGAIVDMSAEVLHPTLWGSVLLAIVATMVNGGAYMLGAWIAVQVRNRLRRSNPR